MQKLLVLSWLVLLPTVAHTQTVTPADLEGYAVDTRVVIDQRTRRDGREFNVQMHFGAQIAFEPDQCCQVRVIVDRIWTARSAAGPCKKGRALLGKVIEARNLDGGQVVWMFENGALTTLRIYGNAGGFKRTIHFARDGADTFTLQNRSCLPARRWRRACGNPIGDRQRAVHNPECEAGVLVLQGLKSPAGLIPNQADRL